MASTYRAIDINTPSGEAICLVYRNHLPLTGQSIRPTVLLIHGFPQTSHQFRHILPILAQHGYRCIAPDYRGAGKSCQDVYDFRKTTMAADIVALLDALGIRTPVHVIGHDIGGMIAYALASRYPSRVQSVCWGECPLPSTQTYLKDRTENAVQQLHFIFHSVANLPEALVAGRERIYIEHFLGKITHNLDAFSEADVDFYAAAYSQPGAMRCAFGAYRAFEEDAQANRRWIEQEGKCKVPTMILSGELSRHNDEAEAMALEVTDQASLEVGVVKGAAHYFVEESPKAFVDVVVSLLRKYEPDAVNT